MKKILLVEDDQNARDLYKEILTSAGYSVETANDGEEGLTKILNGGYSLIFLDVMLPKMDGLSVLAAVKKGEQKSPNGKIVILSNLTHDPVIKEAMELGASDHISKPSLSPEEFVAKVKELL
jgi:CheY-like chemotaxis protein